MFVMGALNRVFATDMLKRYANMQTRLSCAQAACKEKIELDK